MRLKASTYAWVTILAVRLAICWLSALVIGEFTHPANILFIPSLAHQILSAYSIVGRAVGPGVAGTTAVLELTL